MIHKYHFILGNKITNSLEAIACPQRHRICFSEGEILAISLEPCKRKPYRSGWAGNEGNARPHWNLTLLRLRVSRQACFHFPHLKRGLCSSSQGTNVTQSSLTPRHPHGQLPCWPGRTVLPLSFQQCAGNSFTFVLLADPSICTAAGPIQRPCACLPLLPAPAPAQPLSLEKQSVFPNKSPQSWVNPSDISPTAKAAELGLSPQPRSLRLVQRC